MQTFWSVTTICYDSGRITANITSSIEATEMPENTFKSTNRADIYIDWFDNLQDAQDFVNEARNA